MITIKSYFSSLAVYPLFQLKLNELDKFCKYFYGIISKNPFDISQESNNNNASKAKENNQIKVIKMSNNNLTKINNI